MSNKVVDSVLEERQKTHGNFQDHALLATMLKEACHNFHGWEQLPPVYKEGIDMICHKLARIVNGNPLHLDHVVDIQGYAKLMQQYVESHYETIS